METSQQMVARYTDVFAALAVVKSAGVMQPEAPLSPAGPPLASAAMTEADRHAPLRLSRAAALVFPDGSMTASGLRREAARGRLAVQRIAGKDFTTLAAIEDMRTQCLQPPSGAGAQPASDAGKPGATPPPSDVQAALAAARETARQLKAGPAAPPKPAARKGKTRVIQLFRNQKP